MKKLQFELTEVLAKYFEFTMNSVSMSIKREGNSLRFDGRFSISQAK